MAANQTTTTADPLRICMVISSYHPIVGGAEKQVAQLAKRMIAQGHHVTVVTKRYPGLTASEIIDGVHVRRVAVKKPLGALGFIAGAAKEIRTLQPDIVHCHSLFSPSLAGALVQRTTGLPLLVKPMCGGEATSVAEKPLGRQRLGYLARAVDTFLAVSREIEDELLQLKFPRSKIRFVPNGVDGQKFQPAATPQDKLDVRAKLNLPDDLLFLFAGRMAAQKRLPLLLKSWGDVVAKHPEAKLLIAGANRASNADYQATFGEGEGIPDDLLKQPGVILLGHVDDMPTLLKAVDVFVLPSAREGLSNALLEAFAAGLPTVSARIGGAMDFIVDGQNGMQFTVDDQTSLTTALTTLAEDPAKRHALGVAARESVLNGYDIDKTVSSLLAEYRDLKRAKAGKSGTVQRVKNA